MPYLLQLLRLLLLECSLLLQVEYVVLNTFALRPSVVPPSGLGDKGFISKDSATCLATAHSGAVAVPARLSPSGLGFAVPSCSACVWAAAAPLPYGRSWPLTLGRLSGQTRLPFGSLRSALRACIRPAVPSWPLSPARSGPGRSFRPLSFVRLPARQTALTHTS